RAQISADLLMQQARGDKVEESKFIIVKL
ncbi:uncharacterized protein METZ01_LOCUS227908, partial [marine metagenome]